MIYVVRSIQTLGWLVMIALAIQVTIIMFPYDER